MLKLNNNINSDKNNKITEIVQNGGYNKINERLDFIKFLLEDTDLKPMINFKDNEKHYYKDNNILNLLEKKSKSFKTTIKQIGGKLLYVKSGTTGHTFKGISYPDANNSDLCINYAVKVVAYPKKENYGDIKDSSRPENAELLMLKILSSFVVNNQTPHIVLPISTFNTNINIFVSLTKNNIITNKKYDQFVDKCKNNEFHDTVSVLISEWADGGDLLDFLRENYNKLSIREWRVIFFQILSVLAVIQTKYPGFRHNDLKANNILLQKINNVDKNNIYKYNINNNEYYVPNIGLRIKLWDFDFACIPGEIENSKVFADWTDRINVKPEPHPYYDVHYFFNTLTCKNFIPNYKKIPEEVQKFIERVIPKCVKNGTNSTERGRLLLDYDEILQMPEIKYKTPEEIIGGDPFFAKMRPK
jgi:serine/threonine protein kinase